jgi:hypothetical protein
MGYQIAGDPVEEGADASAAPLEQASPDAANPAPETAAPQDSPVSGSGTVTLATVPPLGSVTVDGIEITEGGTEVDADTAARAHEAAQRAGFQLRTIT